MLIRPIKIIKRFNSRSREGATHRKSVLLNYSVVSIHAPVKERRQLVAYFGARYKFQFTLP